MSYSLNNQALEKWLEYKKAKTGIYTKKIKTMAVNRLKNLPPDMQMKAVNMSIASKQMMIVGSTKVNLVPKNKNNTFKISY
jgi:hypothetical protein